MVSELIDKYIWLIQTFIDAGDKGLTLKELSDKWESRYSSSYPRRTFNNHREAIESIFGIEIRCDRSTNVYKIVYAEDAVDQDSSINWIINTFTVNNLLTLSKERLSGRVSVEDIPSGHKFLTTIMQAMLSDRQIVFNYHKYTSSEDEMLNLQPYAMKEADKRWYVVGYCIERQSMRVYSLDRITSLEITETKFKMPRYFDVEDLFRDSFGVYLYDKQPKARIIKFKANKTETRYLEDLPIHSSQTEIERDGDSTIFRIFVIPSDNLIMELCRHGDRIEILEPDDIRDKVAQESLKTAELYYNINGYESKK